jgi:predicted phosphohydrolase
MTLLFATDWHLNFLTKENKVQRFIKRIYNENLDADGLIITGDISSGEVLEKHLTQIAQGFPKPIYITTGNHDFYNSSFEKIDELVADVTKRFDNLYWLNQGWHTYNGIAIVGVGGWYDAYYGNTNSHIYLNDFDLIEDLKPGGLNRDLLIHLIRQRASQEADKLDDMLKSICKDTDLSTVLIATHVAPYEGSSWHEGGHSDRDWLPWFTSANTGAVLDKYADNYPGKKFVVLHGHGHSPGVYRHKDNLIVYTGEAKYYLPDLAGKIDVVAGKIEYKNHIGRKVEGTFP